MKKLTAVFLTLFMLILTAACQPTPEHALVIGEQAASQDSIDSESTVQKGSYPQRYEGQIEFPEANMTVCYGADIIGEKIESTVICTVEELERTDDENAALMQIFSQDSPLYELAPRTKSYWENVLIRFKQKSALGEYDENFDAEPTIREIEQIIEDSPEAIERAVFDWGHHNRNEICEAEFDRGNGRELLQVERNGNYFSYARYPDFALQTESLVLSGDAVSGEPAGTTISVPISEDAALSLADKLISEICEGQYSSSSIKARLVEPYTGENLTNGWLFTYTRKVAGLTAYAIGQDFRINNGVAPALAAPWENESIEVLVDAAGIALFSWQGAIQGIQEGGNMTGKLMELDELLPIVTSQMKYCHANKGTPEHKCIIRIDRIALGTSLLTAADTDLKKGQYFPCWFIFYNLQIDGAPEYQFDDCMVFTATDGRYVEPRMTVKQLMEMQ